MAKRNVRFTVHSETWAGAYVGTSRRYRGRRERGKGTAVGVETQLEPQEIAAAASAVFGAAEAKLRDLFGWEPVDIPEPPSSETQDSPANAASPESAAPTAATPPPSPPAEPVEPADLEPSIPSLTIDFAPTEPQRVHNGLFETRFGGQPDWLDTPCWPISRQDGAAMQFVAQFALHPDDFAWLDEPKMVYLFVTDDEDDPGGYETWDPFAAENALIVQPGTPPNWIETVTTDTGPAVRDQPLTVGLTSRLDPPVASILELSALDASDEDRWYEAIDYNKVGGTPNFFQDLEFPDFDARTVDRDRATAIPIFMLRNTDDTGLNLGDAGRGVGFLSLDQQSGAYLWFN